MAHAATSGGQARFEPQRYHAAAVANHWITAAMVVGLLCSGLILDGLKETPGFAALLPLHASFGMSVLVLTLARLGLRFVARPPALPAEMSGLERWAARIVHGTFYALLLLLPLSGWVIVSVGPDMPQIAWFGLFDLPLLPPPPNGQGDLVATRVAATHGLLGYVMAALVALHVLAALRHFMMSEGTFARMWFGRDA